MPLRGGADCGVGRFQVGRGLQLQPVPTTAPSSPTAAASTRGCSTGFAVTDEEPMFEGRPLAVRFHDNAG
jgi:hypothetical protein